MSACTSQNCHFIDRQIRLNLKYYLSIIHLVLVWFGLVIYACPHRVYACELIMTIASSGKAQETFATNPNIYTQSLKLLFNKRCSQETHREIYARAGTK